MHHRTAVLPVRGEDKGCQWRLVSRLGQLLAYQRRVIESHFSGVVTLCSCTENCCCVHRVHAGVPHDVCCFDFRRDRRICITRELLARQAERPKLALPVSATLRAQCLLVAHAAMRVAQSQLLVLPITFVGAMHTALTWGGWRLCPPNGRKRLTIAISITHVLPGPVGAKGRPLVCAPAANPLHAYRSRRSSPGRGRPTQSTRTACD